MKLLQAARVTQRKDSSSSIDKQDADMARWAQNNEHVIIDTAEDSGVSGEIAPWDRPKLGPWLTDPELIARYDGILASHLDRVGRNTNDFMELLKWCDKYGKTIITTALGEKIDFQKGTGKLIGFVIMWLAEQELETDRRRAKETFAYLRDNGYLTSKCPFGFRIVTIESGGKKRKIIVPDEEVTAPIVRDMVTWYLGGQTLTEICERLDADDVKPPTWTAWNKKPAGKRGPAPIWQPNTIAQLFRNPVLIGRLESKGDVVRNGNGQPLQRCAPLLADDDGEIDWETWNKLQAKLDAIPKQKSTAPADTAMLTGVAVCAKCQGPMYRFTSTRKHPNGKTYVTVYYRCHGRPRTPSTCKNMIKMAAVDAKVTEWIMSHPSLPVVTYTVVKGNDYGRQFAEVTHALEDLARNLRDKTITYAEYRERSAPLDAELGRLSDLKPEPDRIEPEWTGRTLADDWPSMTDGERREKLREGGFTVTAVKTANGPVVTVKPGDEYLAMVEQLRSAWKIPHPRP